MENNSFFKIYSCPSHQMGSSMSLLNMGVNMQRHPHPPSFSSVACLLSHNQVIRTVTDLRESNFSPYSSGLLYIAFWRVSITVLTIRKMYLRRDEKCTFIFCLVSLKISVNTLKNSKVHLFPSDSGNGELIQIFVPMVLYKTGICPWKLKILHPS